MQCQDAIAPDQPDQAPSAGRISAADRKLRKRMVKRLGALHSLTAGPVRALPSTLDDMKP